MRASRPTWPIPSGIVGKTTACQNAGATIKARDRKRLKTILIQNPCDSHLLAGSEQGNSEAERELRNLKP